MIHLRAVRGNLLVLTIVTLFFLPLALARLRFPDLDHGDEFADASVLIAAENFAQRGFWALRFLPFERFDSPHQKYPPYTHYPPLTQIFFGWLRIIFKQQSLYFYRVIAVLISYLIVVFWYLLIKNFSDSKGLGFLVALFYLSNPFFIFGMDSFTQMNMADFFKAAILCLFIQMAKEQRVTQPKKWLTWFLIFLVSFASFEYYFYFPLFLILFRTFFSQTRKVFTWKPILVWSMAIFFAFGLHFLQNAWYFKSFTLAFKDLLDISKQRILASSDSPLPLNFSNWWNHVLVKNFSLVFMFRFWIVSIVFAVGLLFYFNLSQDYRKKINPLFGLLVIFTLLGIGWYVFFPSHSLAHAYVFFLVHHLVPSAALTFAVFVYLVFLFIKQHSGNFFKQSLTVLLVTIIVLTGILRSDLPIKPETINQAKDFFNFKDCLLRLKDKLKNDDVVACNYYRHVFIGYYLKKSCVSVFDVDTLWGYNPLPRYFLFMPIMHSSSVELFRILTQRYKPLFQCPSMRFPFIFLELKEKDELR